MICKKTLTPNLCVSTEVASPILLELTHPHRYVLLQIGKFFFDEISKININVFTEEETSLTEHTK